MSAREKCFEEAPCYVRWAAAMIYKELNDIDEVSSVESRFEGTELGFILCI